MHSQGYAHLDIKPDNLLIDKKFAIKVCDFDLAHQKNDPVINVAGTKNFRAPELASHTCKNAPSADVYSAAIVLFLLKSCGILPSDEDVFGDRLMEMLEKEPKQFWLKHCKI
mmetsp:Transcript_12737/g.10883  ORF Transcript_12737/g.10883 Transcript_12737/m.10883 type:complete len:112 (-) Transcript_12737:668-1003(-)